MDIFKISPHTLYLVLFFVTLGKKLKFHHPPPPPPKKKIIQPTLY